MEINKQLFEDILSGKLKGKFVFRNTCSIYGVELKPNHTCIQEASKKDFYIIRMPDMSFNVVDSNGKSVYCCIKHKGETENDPNSDVIDFVPEYRTVDLEMLEYCRKDFEFMQTLSKAINNMNTLEIEIPEGKEIDWKESEKQNRIVLKDKQLTYKNICEKLFVNKEFFFTNNTGVIESSSPVSDEYLANAANNSTSYHQLECILAKNMLANTAKYLNDGWDPTNTENIMYYLSMNLDKHIFVTSSTIYDGHYLSNILFKSKELAKQAIEILGEKIIKLALTPLGI